MNPANEYIKHIQEKAKDNPNYQPDENELDIIEDWLRKPNIFLNEGQL